MDDPGEDVSMPKKSPNIDIQNKPNRLKQFWQEVEIPLLIFSGFLSLFLGTIGFYKHSLLAGDSYSVATAFYSALGLFKLGGGNVASPVPWELETARWLSPAVAMYAVLLGLAALFKNQARLLQLRFSSGHVVICGLGQKGLSLTKSFRKQGYLVVVIEKDGNHPDITLAREMGVVALIGDARDEYVLRKAQLCRASYLIAVCGDDGTNADIALIAKKLVQKRKGSKLNCSVHIRDPRLWILLRAQEFAAESNPCFRMDFFNIYDQGAKQLLREYPLTNEDGKHKKESHILIVGFGSFSEQLIINSARQWSPEFDRSGRQIHISIIDPDAENNINRIRQEYSLVKRVCRFSLYPFDTSSIEYLTAGFLYNTEKQLEVSSIFVTFEDETVGLSSALALLEKVRATDTKILVRMNEEKGLAHLIQQVKVSGGSFDNLHLFGLLERTCQPELVYNASHEAIAKAIHGEYLDLSKSKGIEAGSSRSLVTWEKLPEPLKEMNREQADSIGKKLNAIHCEIVPWSDFGGDKFVFTPEEIERMSKMEHMRWCKQKFDQGWKYGPIRDDLKKLHPSLIPWEDERLDELEKEKDRNTVRQIPHFLALAGYQIFRV